MTHDATFQFTLSVVSHGQGHLLAALLHDLSMLKRSDFEVIVTLNIPEDSAFLAAGNALVIRVIRNVEPKGFGANHNAAYRLARGKLFAVVNPDIRAATLDLSKLLQRFDDPRVGACAPRILSPAGSVEDSARRFPTLGRLIRRYARRTRLPDYDLLPRAAVVPVDWVAGMFILFRPAAFEAVSGFDERYFMYLEDADICRRLGRAGYVVIVDPSNAVVHAAQRASRTDARHMRWHLQSMLRFLLTR